MRNTDYTVYLYPSPNALKVIIALEELGLEYETVLVDLAEGEQLSAAFAVLNPNRKVPVFKAGELVLFESAAILEYLAVTHNALMGAPGQARSPATRSRERGTATRPRREAGCGGRGR